MACNCGTFRIATTVVTSSGDCICVPDVVPISCNDGPEPCSAVSDTLSYDLSQNLTNDVCSSLTWELRGHDSVVFPDMAISVAGLLTSTVTGGVGGQVYVVVYRVGCDDYKVDGEIHICLENMCLGVECDEGFVCDPCDGSCVEEESDLEVV